MVQKHVVIEANSNFHHLAGEDLYGQKDSRFREYRKKWVEWPEKFYTGKFPLFVDIEVTNACNLKCTFCATTFSAGEKKLGFMPFDTVKKIIDEGADNNLYGVKFNIRGEPLLHPQIHEFVRYAKQKGLIDVYFNTNAVLLTKDIAGALIDAGLDRLSISFEGYSKDVYEKYRVGARYETVLLNLENLQLLKKRLAVQHPKIRIQTVLLPDIEPNFEGYKKFWAGRVEEVSALDYKEMGFKKKGLKYSWACPQVWQRLAIWWDGTILPCNHDDEGVLALGNIGKLTLMQAWHSKKMSQVRDAHRKGISHEVSACDGCYLRDKEISKLQAKD